jgi:hypothetical protein
MLIKLFKHEMRATARTFLWLYIAFVVIAVVNALIMPGTINSMMAGGVSVANDPDLVSTTFPNAGQTLASALYALAIAAIAIVTIVVIILRFFRNLLGDEGYLMMTLPVSREQHMASKLLAATVWSVCSAVLVFLSILLLIAATGSFPDLVKGFNDLIAAGIPINKYILIIILMMLVGTVSSILMLYAAMAIGPNLLKNRIGGSILAFIIIVVASQIAGSGITVGVMSSMFAAGGVGPLAGSTTSPATANGYMADAAMSMIDQIFITAIVYSAIVAIVCWFLTRFMLKRKLNLA